MVLEDGTTQGVQLSPEEKQALKDKYGTDRPLPESKDAQATEQYTAFVDLIPLIGLDKLDDSVSFEPQALFKKLRSERNYDFVPLLRFAQDNPGETEKIKAKLLKIKVDTKSSFVPEVKAGRLGTTGRLDILKSTASIRDADPERTLSAVLKIETALDEELKLMRALNATQVKTS